MRSDWVKERSIDKFPSLLVYKTFPGHCLKKKFHILYQRESTQVKKNQLRSFVRLEDEKGRERERRKPIHQQLVLVIYTWHVWILFIYWSLFIDNRTIFKVQEQKKSIRIKWLGNWLDEKPFLAKREQMRKTWNKRRANEGETTTWSDFLFHFRLLFFTILFTNTPTHTHTQPIWFSIWLLSKHPPSRLEQLSKNKKNYLL